MTTMMIPMMMMMITVMMNTKMIVLENEWINNIKLMWHSEMTTGLTGTFARFARRAHKKRVKSFPTKLIQIQIKLMQIQIKLMQIQIKFTFQPFQCSPAMVLSVPDHAITGFFLRQNMLRRELFCWMSVLPKVCSQVLAEKNLTWLANFQALRNIPQANCLLS